MPTAAKRTLSIRDHSRDSAGLEYVYPVVSRRAGGVSIGINLNPNNACNWRCIYCQVPNLTRGSAPPIDLAQLEQELRTFLRQVYDGDFLLQQVPADARRINDIAISGNGEPTSAARFEAVIERVRDVRNEFPAARTLKIILITNGSLIQRTGVQRGLATLAQAGGEIWFKIDAATKEGMQRINSVAGSPARVLKNLLTATALCPTYIQTCLFATAGAAPSEDERDAYIALLREALARGAALKGVFLYGLARPSLQPEAAQLKALPAVWLEEFGRSVAALGLAVKIVE